MVSSSSAELTCNCWRMEADTSSSTHARPGLRPIVLSILAKESLRRMANPKDRKREEKVLAKLREICLDLHQARKVKTRACRILERRQTPGRRKSSRGPSLNYAQIRSTLREPWSITKCLGQ